MEDSTQGKRKITHLYENRKTYLVHHQLLEMLDGGGFILKFNIFLFIGCYLLLREYPVFLATLDLAFTVLALLFKFVIKPRILKGNVTAYYRRSYKDMKVVPLIYYFLIKGGIQRFIVMFAYYAVSFYLIDGNTREIEKYSSQISEFVLNPKMWAVATVVFAFLLYQLFYKEKYTTVREFSNSVVEIYSQYPYNEQGAVNEFIRRKDAELKLFDMDGVKYDGKMAERKPSTPPKKQAQQGSERPIQDVLQSTTMDEAVPESSPQLIRRKARK